MKPLVSVCIANYNGISIISSCLESVIAQQGDIPIEIIVHDDASMDGSVGYLHEHYPGINLIQSETNVGFCIANNRMVLEAKGDYLLLLNNDAKLFPDAIASLLAKATEMHAPAILGIPQYDMDTGALLDRGSLLDPFLNPVPNLDPARNEVGMVMGACLWIPKNLWMRLGGFPELFGSIGEDLYICCRARTEGYTVATLSGSGYWHKVGHSFGGGKVVRNEILVTSKRRRRFSERNKSYVMVLTYPYPLLQIILPIHLLLLLFEGLLISILKPRQKLFKDVYLTCFIALLENHRYLYALRKSIQGQRKCTVLKFLSVFSPIHYKLTMLCRFGIPRIE